jgi:iron complex outermembrane receptor protein
MSFLLIFISRIGPRASDFSVVVALSRFPRLSLLTSVALVALTIPSAGQETLQLDTITVEGDGGAAQRALDGTGPVDGYVASQTTTGSKTTTPLIEIPQSISVVTQDQLEDRAVQNLGEALGYTAGVVAQPFGNDARYFNPIIRGFEAKDNVYLNSFRFIRDFGALTFEPYGQERIEVLKGPASVLYGQGEPGGLINLVAKRPTFEEFHEVGAEVGSNNRYVGKFDLGGVRDDTLSWRMVGLGRLADGQQDFTSEDRLYLAPSLTWAPSEDTSLTLLGSFQYDTGTSPIGLPQQGTLDHNPSGIIPVSRYIGEPDFNDNEGWLATVGYEFRHRFDDTFEFRQNTQYLAFDADYNNLYFVGLQDDQRTATRGVSVQSETIHSLGVDNQLEARFDTGLLEHTAIFGLDYRQNQQWRSSNFSGSVDPIDVFNPIYGAPVTVDPDNANVSKVRLQQTGLYAQDQIKLDRLSFTLGLRHDWTSSEDRIGGSTADDEALTGRAGAVYQFDNGIAPYISSSTSFNPSSGINTVTGELLKPSEGEQFEAGVKFQPVGWNSFITATAYNLTKTNVATRQLDDTGTPQTTQTGEIRSRGFELEATASLAEGIDLIGSYTYTNAEIVEGDITATGTTTGNRPANIPEHAAALWLGYTFQPNSALEGWSIGGGTRYVGSRYGNNANTISMPSTLLFDAAIRFEKGNFKAALNVNNIADERHIASCNFGCFYGEGRSVIASVGVKW